MGRDTRGRGLGQLSHLWRNDHVRGDPYLEQLDRTLGRRLRPYIIESSPEEQRELARKRARTCVPARGKRRTCAFGHRISKLTCIRFWPTPTQTIRNRGCRPTVGGRPWRTSTTYWTRPPIFLGYSRVMSDENWTTSATAWISIGSGGSEGWSAAALGGRVTGVNGGAMRRPVRTGTPWRTELDLRRVQRPGYRLPDEGM